MKIPFSASHLKINKLHTKSVLFKAARLNLNFLSSYSCHGKEAVQDISYIMCYLWGTKMCGILYSVDSSITLSCYNIFMYSVHV